MYSPKHNTIDDQISAVQFMVQNPFSTLITMNQQLPTVSLVPLSARFREDQTIEILGHVAKNNLCWKSLSSDQATAIFLGSHAPISPTWYEENDVPTWNYSAVEAVGKIEFFHDQGSLLRCLKALYKHLERIWPSEWEFYIPPDLTGAQLANHIVGFRITVSQLQFKRKLSQNRSQKDRLGVLKGLKERGDLRSLEVYHDMINYTEIIP